MTQKAQLVIHIPFGEKEYELHSRIMKECNKQNRSAPNLIKTMLKQYLPND